jgi:hypothetical protein
MIGVAVIGYCPEAGCSSVAAVGFDAGADAGGDSGDQG